MKCYQCGAEHKEKFVETRGACPKCQAYLHCCRNCMLYDEWGSNKCRSSSTEWVPDREKYNFCDEFKPNA
jgi:hypothetical protein